MVNNYDIAVLSEKVAYLEAAIKEAGIELPSVTTSDNTTLLQVVSGKWAKGVKLPAITESDEGKVLNVNSSGAWQVSDLVASDIPYDSEHSVEYIIGDLISRNFTDMSSIGITDVNDLPTGIFYNTSTSVDNLPVANRWLFISVQLLDNPVRILQWAFGLDGSAYQRIKQGDTWNNWQLKIVAT